MREPVIDKVMHEVARLYTHIKVEQEYDKGVVIHDNFFLEAVIDIFKELFDKIGVVFDQEEMVVLIGQEHHRIEGAHKKQSFVGEGIFIDDVARAVVDIGAEGHLHNVSQLYESVMVLELKFLKSGDRREGYVPEEYL